MTPERHAEYAREWRARPENKEKIKATKAASYQRHREKTLAAQKARYNANPEHKRGPARARMAREMAADPDGYRAKKRAEIARRKEANPASFRRTQRRSHLFYRYRITTEMYREHLVGQAGRCAICGLVPPRNLVVDHDHATGRFRGLLCGLCNKMLGMAKDDTGRLAAAIRYLG